MEFEFAEWCLHVMWEHIRFIHISFVIEEHHLGKMRGCYQQMTNATDFMYGAQ